MAEFLSFIYSSFITFINWITGLTIFDTGISLGWFFVGLWLFGLMFDNLISLPRSIGTGSRARSQEMYRLAEKRRDEASKRRRRY